MPAVRTRVTIPIPTPSRADAPVQAEFITFDGLPPGEEHFAVQFPAVGQRHAAPLVRIHSECVTGDVFGSARCDCGPQLREALDLLREHGGVLLYLRQEGRGIGLYNKLDAYRLQGPDCDTFEANERVGRAGDERDYGVAADMLKALGLQRIVLLSNNPDKRVQLTAFGIEVLATRRTGVFSNAFNLDYLRTKAQRAGHAIDLPGGPTPTGGRPPFPAGTGTGITSPTSRPSFPSLADI